MKTIHHTIHFEASPEEVYELIMDPGKHGDITGSEVTMSNEVKGKFAVFDGYCHGHNIELDPGRKIVQAWHFDEEDWDDNHYSTCTFLFTHSGTGCSMSFTQTDVPDASYESLKQGWKDYYWDPMKAYLAD